MSKKENPSQPWSQNAICIPKMLTEAEKEIYNSALKQPRPFHRGKHIFEIGDKFTSLFTICTGSVKVYRMANDGNEQIAGFYLPGETFGADAISSGQHVTSSCALETTTVCEMPFNQLQILSQQIPSLYAYLVELLSEEIHEKQRFQYLLGKSTVEERIGYFLASLSRRQHRRQLSASALTLSMTRLEIASYLGVAVESISRAFSRIQNAGIVKRYLKEVVILDHDRLISAKNINSKTEQAA